jgi:hypothetical protein
MTSLRVVKASVNEFFGFEPKANQVGAIQATEVTRFSSPEQDYVKALSSKHPPDLKRAKLIIVPLRLLQEEQAEKLKTAALAGATSVSVVISGQNIANPRSM